MIEPLRLDFEVGCEAERAFEVWTKRIGMWWPADHTVSGEHDLEVHLEGRVGGRIYERTSRSAAEMRRPHRASSRMEEEMAIGQARGSGTKDDPWVLNTPPGTSEYQMYRDEAADPPALVCQVGSTQLRYHLRAIDDLHAMLKQHGDWMPLGSADEQKPAPEGSVEAWGRSPDNPVGGWYGLRKGLRGRFGMYLPPLLETLGLAELEHNPRNNRMRAI